MKVHFEKDADYDVYKRDYYPLLVRNGFSWRMFPELGIYLDMKYPGWEDLTNTNREHIRPDITLIFARMITLEEWIAAGCQEEEYKRVVMDGKTSSLPHEIGHYIHLTKFGADGSLLWQKACSLMGQSMNFGNQSSGGYAWKQSYEDFANYFEDCVEGRKTDEIFMDFVRGLFGIKHKIYTEGDGDRNFTIVNNRAKAPMRAIIEDFRDQRLRDIDWLEAIREVVVISGESGF